MSQHSICQLVLKYLRKTKEKIETSRNRGSNAEYQRNLHQCESIGTVLGKQRTVLWKHKAFFLKKKSTALSTIKWQRLKDWKWNTYLQVV